MFIWTISDAIAVLFVAAIVLLFGICFAVIGAEKLWRKIKRAIGVQR